MSDEEGVNPVWMNVEAVLEKASSLERSAMPIALDLIAMFSGSSGQPIDVSNEAELLRVYAQTFPNRPPSLKKWQEVKADVMKFFIEVRVDLWAPSPEFFVLNNPYSEQQSGEAK